MKNNIPLWIILHHTAVSYDKNPDQFNATNIYHKSIGFPISSLGFFTGYQYEINKDGKVYQARIDTETGAHTKGMNNSSIGICADGNFDIEMPTPAQVASLRILISRLSSEFRIPPENIVPHRKFANKTCYGSRLSDDWARSLASPDLLQEKERLTTVLIGLLTVKLKSLQDLYARLFGRG